MAYSSLPLHQAIWQNDEDAVISYMEKGEDLNAEDENALKPIHIAIMKNNEKMVKQLLKDPSKKVTIDSKAWYYLISAGNENMFSLLKDYNRSFNEEPRDENGLTPLHYAVISQNSRFIDLFYKSGCSVISHTKNGFTALHFAAVANDLDTIDYLLVKNAFIHAKTVDGSTALHLAVRYKYTDCASFLIAMGSDVNYVVTSTGSSALHIAVQNNDQSMIELLLQNNADVMCRDLNGKNVLHVAAQCGHDKLVSFFLKKGVDINSVTNDNSTPLLTALIHNKQTVATILLDHKANLNLRNNDWLSPLCAALQLKSTRLCKRLITLEADVNNVTLKNSSVLHFAVKYSDKSMVAALVKRGAKLGVRDYLGRNELHIAALYCENSDMIQYLLKAGMNVNELTSDRSTALHCAVSSSVVSRNIIEILIKNGVSVDAENENGDTAFNIICRSKDQSDRYNIVEDLLKAKADPNHAGSDKKMPLYTCIEKDTIGTAMLLAKYGACLDNTNLNEDSVLQLLVKFASGCACTRRGYMSSFLDLGANINSVNVDGETVLHTSLINEKHECLPEIKYLLDKGICITKNNLNENVMHFAIKNLGTDLVIEDIINFFLEKDVNLHEVTTNKCTIIHYLAQYCNNSDVMKLLLDKTKNFLMNYQNNEGKTPLHIVAALGSNTLVEVLLDHDADINKKDNDNNTAINHAIIGNHIETVKLLLKRGASTTDKNKEGFDSYDLAEQKGRHIYQILLNR